MSTSSDDRLVARWLTLTREVLPGMAAAHGWPIRLDHCFMRVCLDHAIGRRWDTVVARPAIRHLDPAQFSRAVACAEAIIADPTLLPALNNASLAMRGHVTRKPASSGNDPGERLLQRRHDGYETPVPYANRSPTMSEPTKSVDVLYQTTATATGGRDGSAKSADGRLAVQLSTPKELGGAGGDGSNPEQLFAAGYSACFIGALKVAGQQLKLSVPADTTVTATVGIGPRAKGGFGITADLVVALPSVAPADARRLVDRAHEICPYSNAMRDNVGVGLTIA